MKATFLLASFLCLTAPSAWQTLTVDPHLAVQLPTPVTELNFGQLMPGQRFPAHLRAWTAEAPDGRCIILRTPNPPGQHIAKQDTARRRVFYQQAMASALAEEAAPHVLSCLAFATPAGSGVELKYVVWDTYVRTRRVRYLRCLVLDSVKYSLLFRPTTSADSVAASSPTQRRFFASLKINR